VLATVFVFSRVSLKTSVTYGSLFPVRFTARILRASRTITVMVPILFYLSKSTCIEPNQSSDLCSLSLHHTHTRSLSLSLVHLHTSSTYLAQHQQLLLQLHVFVMHSCLLIGHGRSTYSTSGKQRILVYSQSGIVVRTTPFSSQIDTYHQH
jgi:hypothetical protein